MGTTKHHCLYLLLNPLLLMEPVGSGVWTTSPDTGAKGRALLALLLGLLMVHISGSQQHVDDAGNDHCFLAVSGRSWPAWSQWTPRTSRRKRKPGRFMQLSDVSSVFLGSAPHGMEPEQYQLVVMGQLQHKDDCLPRHPGDSAN